MPSKLHIPLGMGSLPLDPPPFLLEKEIRLSDSFVGLGPVMAGVLILGAYVLLFHNPRQSILPFWHLMGVSAAAGGLYLVGGLFSYWAAWLWVTTRHSVVGGIHPAARGELPRNVFLAVLLVPGAAVLTACLLASRAEQGFAPELWLAVAVVAGNVLRDLRAAWHLVSEQPACWVKRTRRGLDVLRPVDRRSHDSLQ